MRLSDSLIQRLDRAAERMGGVDRAKIIRMCVDTFLRHFESHGGIASLPLNWRELLRAQDGRSHIIQIGNYNEGHIVGARAASDHPEYRVKRRPKRKK